MADRYDSFAVFMAEVVQRTKTRVTSNPVASVADVCASILRKVGWVGFCTICVLLGMGYFAFAAALVPFLLTPVGLAIVAIGGAATMWALWRNRKLPLSVKKVGDRVKPRYESAAGNSSRIDSLQDEAVSDLYNELIS